jgi:cholesterol transport system auxiliary component
MSRILISRFFRHHVVGILIIFLTGCGVLRPEAVQQPSFYSLDNTAMEINRTLSTLPTNAPTLLIDPPLAASGFDSQRIIYTRESHQLEYFAHSEWIDTPARMIEPLIVSTIANSGAFHAVAPATSAASGDLRLDTEIVRLQHDFDSRPSRLRFTLRAYILDNATRRVLAWREIDEVVVPASDAPYDGIVAANRAVQNGLHELTALCEEASRNWQQSIQKPTLCVTAKTVSGL